MDTKKKILSTSCPRCRGLLAVERVPWSHEQIYCVNCGLRLDPLIDDNKAAYPPPRAHTREERVFPVLLSR